MSEAAVLTRPRMDVSHGGSILIIDDEAGIREGGAFDGGIVAGARQRDDAFFSGVGVDDQTLESRRNNFIFFGE